MTHEIDMSNDRANMAYVGETPWHGLGQQLQPGLSIDEWCAAAGLNWCVKQTPVAYDVDGYGLVTMRAEGQYVLYRSDTKAALGVVGERYVPMQPCAVLEFYRDLVADFGYTIETAGSLFGGRKIWAMAKTPFSGEVVAGDNIKGYLLLTTGADGQTPTIGMETSVRVVCNNTLSFAVCGSEKRVQKRHTASFNADAFKKKLGIYQDNFQAFMETARQLSARVISADVRDNIIKGVFGVAANDKDESTRTKNIIAEIVASVENGPGAHLAGVRGTAWGLVNGVTHYLDHLKSAKSDELRFYNNQFGKGGSLKQKIVELALAA